MKKNFTYQIGENATFTDFGRMDLDMLNYKAGLFNQRNSFHRIFHGVDVERVRAETADVQAEVGKIRSEVAEIDTTIQERKLWGSVVLGLFILAGVIFLLVRKAYEEEERS